MHSWTVALRIALMDSAQTDASNARHTCTAAAMKGQQAEQMWHPLPQACSISAAACLQQRPASSVPAAVAATSWIYCV